MRCLVLVIYCSCYDLVDYCHDSAMHIIVAVTNLHKRYRFGFYDFGLNLTITYLSIREAYVMD